MDIEALLAWAEETLDGVERHTGREAELGQVVERLEGALAGDMPQSGDDRARLLTRLSRARGLRFDRYGETGDLDAAGHHAEDAVADACEDEIVAEARRQLGMSLSRRYDRYGDPADLDRSLDLHQQVLAATPEDHRERHRRLASVGNGCLRRHDRQGEMADLERALDLEERALAATPEDHPDRPGRLANLAVSLDRRYIHLGDPADLERALDLEERALAATPEDHPDHPVLLAYLASNFRSRFDKYHGLTELNRSIELLEQSLQFTHIYKSIRRDIEINLAAALQTRFVRKSVYDDLRRAVLLFSQIISEINYSDTKASSTLANASRCFLTDYDQRHTDEMLWRAYTNAMRGFALDPGTTTKSPFIREAYFQAAAAFHRSTLFDETPLDLHLAVARRLVLTQPEVAFDLAEDVADRAATGSEERADALLVMIDAGERLLRLAPRIEDKEAWVAGSRDLGLRTVESLRAAGRPAAEMVRALERCQNGLLAHALDANEAVLERLASEPDNRLVAQRYRTAAHELKTLRERERDPDVASPEPARLAEAEAEVTAAIAAIRAQPGSEDFAGEVDAEAAIAAAARRPLVYLCPLEGEGMAFFVEAVDDGLNVETVVLPEFDRAAVQAAVSALLEAGAQQRSDRHGRAGGGWLEALGRALAWQRQTLAPLLDVLADRDAPLITLVPIGAAALLPPLPATTDGDVRLPPIVLAPSACVAAAGAQPEPLSSDTATDLLVLDRQIFHAEIGGKIFASGVLQGADTLYGESAEIAALAQDLASCRLAHFFAHGEPDLAEPTRSAVVLDRRADRRLTVWDVLTARLRYRTELLVLASCSLGLPGQKVPSEMISLPAALLYAGVGCVVAAMWDVEERATFLLMERFHDAVRRDGLAPPQALAHAQAWMRDTSADEKRAHYRALVGERGTTGPLRTLMGLVGAGGDRADGDFDTYAHPNYWAGFAVFGSAG